MEKENGVFEGDLVIEDGSEKVYQYTKITGSLYIRADAKTAFPRLQSVGGYVYASAN